MTTKQPELTEVLETIKRSMEVGEDQRKFLRLERNIQDFLSGNTEILKNNEFVSGLISYFVDVHPDLGEEKDSLIESLGHAAISDDGEIRERAHMVLSSAVQFFLGCDAKEKIFLCQEVICIWLSQEEEMSPSFPTMNKRLEEIFHWLLKASYIERAENIATVLFLAKNVRKGTGKALQSVIGKTLENLAKRATLEQMTDGYLRVAEQKDIYKNILIAFGERSVTYLLNRLTQSYSRTERLALIALIPEFQEAAITPVKDCLDKKPPWIIVRNLIYIVGEIGQSDYFSRIEEFLTHSDERVQHEMISCILKLGGTREKERLLNALVLIKDRLKIYVIRLLLGQHPADTEVSNAICILADKRKTFSAHSGFDLIIAIIAALKEFPTRKSIDVLTDIDNDYRKVPGSEEIVRNIRETLNIIEPQVRHSDRRLGGFVEISFDSDPIIQEQVREKNRAIEAEINDSIARGDVEHTSKLVYDYAVNAAIRKDFSVAEMLRDRLLEVNPMAMADVMELGNLIEDEKSSSITTHHLAIWRELYDDMSTEEFNALYYALRTENYREGDLIVKSGETDSSLYFVNSGYLSLSCLAAGNEIFLKRMKPSDILGSEQFFAASVWTVTLKALSELQLQVLEYSDWLKVVEEFPELERTFPTYCKKYENVPKLLKMAGDDRREYPRYKVNLTTKNTLVDSFGTKGRELNGELIDISEGGYALTLRISNRKNAKLLLSRKIVTNLEIDGKEVLNCSGVVVAVRSQSDSTNDYSIHIKTSQRLERSIFQQILSLTI